MAETTAVIDEQSVTVADNDPIYRRNFVFFLGDFIVFSIALSLIGASTVIPDFVRKLTGSEVLIALSSQMFEIGWLLPQLLVARRLMLVERKKWWFIGPNIPVRTLILAFAGIVVVLGPDHRTAILACFLVFYALAGLGDGIVGVPWVDLAASSLDNRRRARLFGQGNALVGVLILGVTPVVGLILSDKGPAFPNNYALLFAVAGALFVLTIPMGIFIQELPGGKPSESMPSMREYLPDLARVLRQDRPYRAMIATRLLSAFFTLASPFYIGFATERLHMPDDIAVSRLLLMQTLGGVVGSLLFSRYGDRHILYFIRGVLVIGLMQPVMALFASAVGPGPLYVTFFGAGVVSGTLVLSCLNWVILYATPEQRPVYSGLFNSASAVALLTAPFIGGTIVGQLSYEAAFVAALVIMASALYVALRYLEAPRSAALSTR
jgi:MFS family permease